jgi:hypothetical protein
MHVQVQLHLGLTPRVFQIVCPAHPYRAIASSDEQRLGKGNMECPQAWLVSHWAAASRLIALIGHMGCIRATYLSRTPSYHPSIANYPSLLPRSIMSTDPSTSTSQFNFASVFNTSLESYKRNTKNDLASHPLLPSLQSCESPEAVLTVLRDQVPAFNQSRNGDDGLTKWVTPTVNVLYSFSETVGQGVGLVNIKRFSCWEFLP